MITGLIDEHQRGSLQEAVLPTEPLDALSWQTQVARLGALFDDLVVEGRE